MWLLLPKESIYDMIPREFMLWDLEKKWAPLKYIKLIKDMYDEIVTSVRTSGFTNEFTITTSLHQGLALSMYLFTIVIDVLTKSIQEETLLCMPFAIDIVLVH